MEGELLRVINHPGLGLKHWNLETAYKFVEIVNIINDIQRMINRYRLTQKVHNRFGQHYKECMWAQLDVTCGPDTCICTQISMDKNKITLLLKEMESALKIDVPCFNFTE